MKFTKLPAPPAELVEAELVEAEPVAELVEAEPVAELVEAEPVEAHFNENQWK